jgi:predicted phosphohydrolase
MAEELKRVLVTADLHFGLYPDGDDCTLRLAEFVRESDADALIIAGDVADSDPDWFAACLDLFTGFQGLKMVVPGNHDLWSAGIGSEKKYREVLPRLSADSGFRMLDVGPVTLGGVGFIGNIGWYDYSFRSAELNVTLEQYREKRLPGVCTWNDGRFIDWEIDDREFTQKCVRKLTTAYRSIEPRVHTVVATLHHLPFSNLMYGPASPTFEFCRAFLGSQALGEALKDLRKVRYVFAGHRHAEEKHVENGLEAYLVGSDYMFKRLFDLDLTTGEHRSHLFDSDPAKKTTDFVPPPEP